MPHAQFRSILIIFFLLFPHSDTNFKMLSGHIMEDMSDLIIE